MLGQAPAAEVPHSQHLKGLVASAELAPFSKLGGVADVAAALSKELRRLGHDVRVVCGQAFDPRPRFVDRGVAILDQALRESVDELAGRRR